MADLDKFKLINGPSTVYYIPNFVSRNEEELLLHYIKNVPQSRWTVLSNRKLQRWGGEPHPKGMIPEPLPDWLDKLTLKIVSLGALPESKKPNHVLINEYLSGQGIMPHFDGDLYYPVISTISLGSHCVLRFHDENCSDVIKYTLWLEPGSLLILKDDLYSKYKHSIEEVKSDEVKSCIMNIERLGLQLKTGETIKRGTRLSITMRHIEKIIKVKLNLFKK